VPSSLPAQNTVVKRWSLTTLREKLIKIGAKVVSTARYVVFQTAEVAVPRGLFRAILERIRRLRPPSVVFRGTGSPPRSHETQGDGEGGLSPMGQTRLPEPQDADFDTAPPAIQRIRTPKTCLSGPGGQGKLMETADDGRQREVIWEMSAYNL